ncbi:BTB/POZ domain-containing protein kctd15-like [Diadema setosum]|uniref:BTB/POZ domain-containing protein kctd15-like n=1 Tax=Diadema setosum TaxID=31175 RepID=UPI003B3B4DA1
MDDFVNINVGGTIYTASRATLCRFPDSMLGSMFSDRLPSTRDEKGNYLIDGDGPLFRHVLNFLRRSALVLSEDFKELDMLAQEADYYQINELIDAVTQLRNEKEEAEKRQEFLEVQLIHSTSRTFRWKIFGRLATLQEIPALTPFVGNHSRVQTNSEIYGIRILGYGANNKPQMNRIKLYEQIAQIGFKLVSLSSRGGDSHRYHDSVDRFLYSRDAKTTFGTDPSAK